MQKDKLLIVDDEKEIADLISLYLNNEGFQVFTFYNATDALQCIQTEDLDLAILDIMLPDPGGTPVSDYHAHSKGGGYG